MKGFAPQFTDFPDYILKITREIWEERGIATLNHYYAEDIPMRFPEGVSIGNQKTMNGTLATLAECNATVDTATPFDPTIKDGKAARLPLPKSNWAQTLDTPPFRAYPVTGGFARSVVNFDAGAQTPAAGAYTAVGLAVAALALTPLVFFLPQATLAATIIVAVLTLVDFSILKKTWGYSKADFTAVAATIVLTLASMFAISPQLTLFVFLFLPVSPTIRAVESVLPIR